jgi:prepilin peptidase CpaA
VDEIVVLAVAAVVATAAAVLDLRSRRIPNWLTGSTLAVAVLANTWMAGPTGLVTALAGAALGLLLLLPFYAVRGVGAGDVKLLAAIGALVGAQSLLWVCLFGALVGGTMSVILLIAHRRVGLTLAQVMALQLPATGLRAPYGIAIAGGVYLAALSGSLG